MSSFSALNTARTALWAAQRGMDVTGQNVANVNTEGYSRQRAELQSIGGNAVPAVFSTSNQVGGGVSADQVTRIRDAFLEGRAHVEHATTARMTAQAGTFQQIEAAFREPGTTGIQSMLADVSTGWQAIANHPDDLAARGQLLQRLETLVSGLHFTRGQLDTQWQQTRDNLQVQVSDVNAAAGQIADLNTQIKQAMIGGRPVNELADKRDHLVMSLADKIGATVTPGDDGSVNVIVGGTTLVSGGTALQLGVTGATDPDSVAGSPPAIVTVPAGTPMRVGGTAEGQLSALIDTVPGYRAQLDGLAQQLVSSLNTAHANGWDLDGDPGMPLLDDGTGSGTTAVDPSTVTAGNIRVRITRPQDIAASSVDPVAAGTTTTLDGGNADAITQLSLDPNGIEAKYRALIVNMGVESAVATRNLDIQNVITGQVDASRDSVMGVSIDEEMTNMLSFQHAYSAAGRLVTAIDEMLDTLINRTGLVGR